MNGFAVVLIPDAQFNAVLDAVQPTYDWDLDIYTVPCSYTPPDLVFKISGEEYSVNEVVIDVSLFDFVYFLFLSRLRSDRPKAQKPKREMSQISISSLI